MIINVRGTNGAGKSTIVKKIIESHETVTQIEYPPEKHRTNRPRKRPMGYLCACDNRRLFVPGHYEIANGGIDTMQDLDYTYELILEHHGWGANVIYEGMNFSDNVKRIIILNDCLDMRVIFLDYPLADCIAAVRARGHKIAEKTIEHLYYKTKREIGILNEAKVPFIVASRENALGIIKQWLELE